MSHRRLQPNQICHLLPGSIPVSANGSTVYPAYKSETGHVLDSSLNLATHNWSGDKLRPTSSLALETAPFPPHSFPLRPPCKLSHPQDSLPPGDCELYFHLQSLQVSVSRLWSGEKRCTGEAWAQCSGMFLPSGGYGLYVHSSLFSTLTCSRPISDASSSLSSGLCSFPNVLPSTSLLCGLGVKGFVWT